MSISGEEKIQWPPGGESETPTNITAGTGHLGGHSVNLPSTEVSSLLERIKSLEGRLKNSTNPNEQNEIQSALKELHNIVNEAQQKSESPNQGVQSESLNKEPEKETPVIVYQRIQELKDKLSSPGITPETRKAIQDDILNQLVKLDGLLSHISSEGDKANLTAIIDGLKTEFSGREKSTGLSDEILKRLHLLPSWVQSDPKAPRAPATPPEAPGEPRTPKNPESWAPRSYM